MKILSKCFFLAADLSKRFFDKAGRNLYTSPPSVKDVAYAQFCQTGGESLRFEYKGLDNQSLVFDLGGYEGQWASDLYGRYQSKIYIFEVYEPFYQNIKNRFSFNNDIQVFNFGLASENRIDKIAIDAFSTSAFKVSADMVEIKLKTASTFIQENQISKIDLVKINIEGAEYELLNHLIATGLIKIIGNLQIQFHDFIPNAFNEMNDLRKKLQLTHYPTYQFDFIWENWKLK